MEGLINVKKYFNYLKRRFIINNYYTSMMKNGRSLQSVFIDFIFILIFIVLISASIIYKTVEDLFLTITIPIIVAMVYAFLFVTYNRKNKIKQILKINDEIAHKEIIEIINEKDSKEFSLYIKEILQKYYKTRFYEFNTSIDFVGEINGEIYGVKCFKKPLSAKISLDDLSNFIQEMNEKNINEGIVVTNTYFNDDLKKEIDYILIDFNHIKRILRGIGQYPTPKDIEDLIISKHENRKKLIKEKVKSRDKGKVLKFLVLGIVLTFYSKFVGYKLYYRIFGYISISLGLILGIYNTIRMIKEKTPISK